MNRKQIFRGAEAGIFRTCLNAWFGFLACVACILMTSGPAHAAVDSETPPAASPDSASVQDMLRAWLQLQEQLHTAQLAIERNRQENEAAATRMAETLASRLQGIEQSLSAQRTRELESIQSSNRTLVIVAGAFAGIGFVAMILTAYFQWRAFNRLAVFATPMHAGHFLESGRAVGTLGSAEHHMVSVDPVDQSNTRLLGAIDRLEKRILELEQTARPSPNGHPDANGDPANEPENAETTGPANWKSLLGKGQSLLNLDQAEEALACFDSVLAADPQNAEALVKKGTALERLRRINEAIDCYDRAIAADDSLTIAYLCKGGLCNRLERFSEALDCYERALRTQEKRAGA